MNPIKQRDLVFGLNAEERVHKQLENVFGELKSTKDEYGNYYEFDKFNDKVFVEIKTRRIRHNQYDTLFFGQNKFLKGQTLLEENPDLKIFYCWNCNDGIYGWEHDSSEFKVARRGRWDRGKQEIDWCIDIKTKYIKPLEELNL